jgi:oxygen-independent coproporphyrinogen-3 oxidase
MIDGFMHALLKEIKMVASEGHPLSSGVGERGNVHSWTFDTIYFGGGTPSLLKPEYIEAILNEISRYYNLTTDIEITFEANPGDNDLNYFRRLFSLGINRLNLGVQSFDQDTLKFLGRRHGVEQARTAIGHARQVGFKNIGLDLIYGVPGQKVESWHDTLSKALEYSPEHLSCYQLTIEENTPFSLQVQKGYNALPDEEDQREFFMHTAAFLEAASYVQYEVSNFAKSEFYFSRHNQKYWDHTPYLGLGPGAHSFDSRNRWWNLRSVDGYIDIIGKGGGPIQGEEKLTQEQLFFEDIFLGLRTKKGIHLQTILEKHSRDLIKEKGKILSAWEKEGLVIICDGYLRPTHTGLAVADRLALF